MEPQQSDQQPQQQWTPEQLARWTPEELEKGQRYMERLHQARDRMLADQRDKQQTSSSPVKTDPSPLTTLSAS